MTATNVSVKAATHEHYFYYLYTEREYPGGYNNSGHNVTLMHRFGCSCRAATIRYEYTTESHSTTLTNYHHGTMHTYGESCTRCGWNNTSTYSCPGGNGGPCVTPY